MELSVLRVIVLTILGLWSVVTAAPTTFHDNVCFDRKDCSGFNIHTACCGQYERFSRYNCARHCGFCTPTVTEAPLCIDTIPNCNEYNSDLCINPGFVGFVKSNCAGFCGLCNKTAYVPPCVGNGTASMGGGDTTPEATTTPPTTTPIPDKCISSDGKFYSEGEKWYTKDCSQSCTCEDFVSNTITCEPNKCPVWIHNCDLIDTGGCCPVLKCNYFNTVYGPERRVGKK